MFEAAMKSTFKTLIHQRASEIAYGEGKAISSLHPLFQTYI